jgi:hypothetical protein
MLYEFIKVHQDEIVARCRARVAVRSLPADTDIQSAHGVPVFLAQLVKALHLGLTSDPEIGHVAVKHGRDLQSQGFTMSQVVHGYGDVCQTITEMAVESGAPITTADFRTLNGCLDDAIAGAVTEYGRQRSQSAVDLEFVRGSERLGFLAHELRNLANTAVIAFEVLKSGNVGVSGSTGAVLERSLTGLRTLIARSLDEVRLARGARIPASQVPFLVSELIQEIEPAATMEAHAVGVRLNIAPVENGVTIQADRPVLAAALENLLQNAFKFTRPHTTVALRVVASRDRVRIEVEDECGGLPGDDVDQLFRAFEQRGADRSGLGLGLAFTRWGIEANHGRVYARRLPDRGCVFTIELPRLPAAAAAVESVAESVVESVVE